MRNIDQIIVSGQWEIDLDFGMQVLSQYLHDLELVSSGILTFSELGYAEQRAALEPVLLDSDLSGRSALYSADLPSNSIVKLSLSGAMRMEDGLSSRGVRQLIEDIQAADANPNIGGILIEVNSGGGQSIAGAELQNALLDVKRRGKTKTLAYAISMASAAVRGMLPVDHIIANNGAAQIGSIGAMYSLDKRLLEDIKNNIIEIYAEQSTNKNIESRELLKGNYKPLQKLATGINQHFLDEVQQYRTITGTPSEIAEVFSGKIFTADIALQRGLIDGIGTFGQAVEKLRGLIESNNNTIVVNPEGDFSNNHNDMDFKSFISKLIPGLNSLLGLELKEDAKAEDVLDAVSGAKSFEDRLAEMKAELTSDAETLKATIKAELAQEQEVKLTELDSKITDLSNKVETLQAENAQLQADKTELEAQITALESERTELDKVKADLESKIVDLKGKRGNLGKDGSEETANSSAPDTGAFQTVNGFYAAITTPPGESEF